MRLASIKDVGLAGSCFEGSQAGADFRNHSALDDTFTNQALNFTLLNAADQAAFIAAIAKHSFDVGQQDELVGLQRSGNGGGALFIALFTPAIVGGG